MLVNATHLIEGVNNRLSWAGCLGADQRRQKVVRVTVLWNPVDSI